MILVKQLKYTQMYQAESLMKLLTNSMILKFKLKRNKQNFLYIQILAAIWEETNK
jgi:hypothetical protein